MKLGEYRPTIGKKNINLIMILQPSYGARICRYLRWWPRGKSN
jgi:hypothetical protein